ncbi:MAG: hypothetical protein Q9O24_11105 [Gammaproteobacteria bacterium]|nr:hypothetical protein [Gammaproteobacteria bacterium]
MLIKGLLAIGVILTYIFIYQADPNYIVVLGDEDHPIEYMSALFLFTTFVTFTYLYIRSKQTENQFFGKKTQRNVYFVLLALFFFVCFGEELSWGQRIFGWETPENFKEMNAQKETNLHNIWAFYDEDAAGEKKSFLSLMLSMNRLFALFCLITTVIIPLTHRYIKPMRTFYRYAGIPIAPIWIGGLFVLNYIAFKITGVYGDPILVYPLDEFKEFFYAMFFMVLAFWFTLEAKRNEPQ